MPFLIAEIFQFFAEGFFLSANREQERGRKRRRQQLEDCLEVVAGHLDGSVRKPWFRKVRVLGNHEGRDVEVIWLGGGRVEVRCRSRREIDLRASVSFFSRLFGNGEPSVTGAWSGLSPQVRDLFRRYEGTSMKASAGELVVRAKPGLDAGKIVALATEAIALAWAPTATVVRVEPRASAAPATVAVASGNLRCPFCHDGLEQNATVVHCAACDAPHHPSCFEEGDGCSISGCKHRKARGSRTQA